MDETIFIPKAIGKQRRGSTETVEFEIPTVDIKWNSGPQYKVTAIPYYENEKDITDNSEIIKDKLLMEYTQQKG